MQLQIPPGDALHIALFQRSHTEKYSEKIYHKTCSISNLTLAPSKKKKKTCLFQTSIFHELLFDQKVLTS